MTKNIKFICFTCISVCACMYGYFSRWSFSEKIMIVPALAFFILWFVLSSMVMFDDESW